MVKAAARAAALALALLGPSPAAALTLDEAIDRALRRNEVQGIAEARLEQARAQRRVAIARLLPVVNARGTWTTGPAITRNLGGGGEVQVQPASTFAASISASANLLDPAAIPLVTAASRDARAQAFASEELRRDLAFEVAQAYATLLASRAVLDAAERRVEVAGQALDAAQDRLEAGLTNRNDVTRTELALSEARLVRTDARQAVELARIALGYLIVEEVAGEELAPLQVPLPPADAPAGELAAEARLLRPDFLSLELQVAAADARDDEPLLRLLPTLDLSGTWSATDNPGFTGRDTDWRLIVGLNWAIYDGGRRYAEARLFDAQTRELALQRQSLSRQIDREVAEALVDLDRGRVAAEEATVRARIARQNEEEVVLRFEAGLATALEQADAIAQRFEAEAEEATEALQLQTELLELRSVLGLWPLGGDRLGEEERG